MKVVGMDVLHELEMGGRRVKWSMMILFHLR